MGAKTDLFKDNLTIKQEAFAQAFVTTHNATTAYEHAYDVSPNTKKSSNHASARNVLQRPQVAARVLELQSELLKEFKMDRAWFLNQLLIKYYLTVDEKNEKQGLKVLEALGKHLGLDKDSTEALARVVLYAPDNHRINKSPQESSKDTT